MLKDSTPKTDPRDPREYFLLADRKPLREGRKGIPKEYLRRLAGFGEYETQGNLARKLSEGGRTISRTTLSQWINGSERMSNRSVIYVSHVLNVSPLCVLDLCAPYETEASAAHAGRIAIAELLQCLYDWQTTGERTRTTNLYALATLADMNLGNPETPDKLRDAIEHIKGDYRDLQQLAIDTATYYAGLCDLGKMGGYISRIVEAGRACAFDLTGQG